MKISNVINLGENFIKVASSQNGSDLYFWAENPTYSTKIENETLNLPFFQVNLSLYDLTYKVKIQTK